MSETKIYRCGTLTYTKVGLLMLFFYLLWGDFCYMMMECISANVSPLIFKKLNASNLLISVILGSVPSFLNFVINPVISTWSDRLRTRWGRRIPFLLFTPPFTAFFLILLAYYNEIGAFIHRSCMPDGNLQLLLIVLVSIFVTGYQLFDLFVGSVYYYIFNDVVPPEFFGRFMAFFRFVTTGASMLFNLILMPHIQTHMTLLLVCSAVIYVISFTTMSLKVKEGEYPPVPKEKKKTPFQEFKVYARDCFSQPFYLVLFIGLAFNMISQRCRTLFNLLFAMQDLHLTTESYGRIMFAACILGMALCAPTGYLTDKFHPLRMFLVGAFLVVLVNPIGFFFVHGEISFLIISLVLSLVYTIQGATLLPLCAKLYPKEKFGQFCSAAAMVRSLMAIGASAVAGYFIDKTGYRYLFVWDFLFTVITFGMVFWVYLEWKRMGGDSGYVPPIKN